MSNSCNLYGYYYRYDYRNRCVEKKLPGADPVYYIYDKADQLIFTQDGEQRVNGKWTFTIPDALGRTVLQGICTNPPSSITGVVKATYGDNATGIFASFGYTLSGVLPTLDQIYQVFYYDNYKFKTKLGIANSYYAYSTTTGFEDKLYNTSPDEIKSKGLLTGTVTSMLDTPVTKLYSVFYYDNRDRMIQSISSNHLGGYEKEYINYSFTGQPTRKQTVHSASGKSTITETYTYAYDHANRPTTIKYKLDSNTEITLSALAYDNFGRLNEKKLHGAKETIAYTYNIRSWLKTIASTNFSETLYYNESYAGNSPVFNGNISATVSPRTSSGTTIPRGYLYTYDGLNRMTKARYMENSTVKNSYNEELAYDKQGNVIEFTRNSPVSSGSSTYNSEHLYLRYTGNQLNATATSSGLFTLLSKNIYNKNGALTADPNRKISDIRYNVLNLPDTIKFSAGHSAQYSYDAAGVKRSMKHITVENTTVVTLSPAVSSAFTGGTTTTKLASTSISSTVTTSTSSTTSTASTSTIAIAPLTRIVDQTVTDYCGPVIYENGSLKYILTPEGYVSKNGSTVVYNYYLKDHLGNNRVVTAVNGSSYTAIQKTDYYPFGKPYADGEFPERQPYKFGGKEYDEMFGMNQYDFEARQLDAMIPRFTTMDPLAEKYYSVSPYAYCANNPVKYVDPDGRDIRIRYVDEDGKKRTWTFNGTNQDQAPKNQFVSDFISAYNYNVENGGGDKLQEAAKSTDYTIDVVRTDNNVSSSNQDNGLNFIRWNPTVGLETDKGTLSPATILEHETDHAVEYETNYYKQLENERSGDDHFQNKEEKRVITGSEYKTGVANGELKTIPKGRINNSSSYRSHVRGKNTFVPVVSPISNKKKK